MKTAFVSFATAVLLVASVAGQTLQINTPTNVVVCQPVQFTWSGGSGPFFLSILPGNQPSAAALENLGTQTGTSFTWLADIAAGTSIGLNLRDSTGTTAQSAPFTINPGSDSSCVGKGTSSASTTSTASGGSTPVPSPSSSSSSTSPKTSPTTPTTPASKTPTSSAPASTTTTPTNKSSGATTQASFVVAGLVGVAVIALLA